MGKATNETHVACPTQNIKNALGWALNNAIEIGHLFLQFIESGIAASFNDT
jgi:hypothetical protein